MPRPSKGTSVSFTVQLSPDQKEEVARLAQIEGRSMGEVFLARIFREEEEPRVRDLELAERLGYDRPRDVRKLIARMIEEGKFASCHVRDTVSRTWHDGSVLVRRSAEAVAMPRGGEREQEVAEYWLTEAQALKVIAKSETKRADQILDEVIRVFILARRGLLPVDSPSAPVLPPATQDALAALRGLVEALTALLGSTRPTAPDAHVPPPPAPTLDEEGAWLWPWQIGKTLGIDACTVGQYAAQSGVKTTPGLTRAWHRADGTPGYQIHRVGAYQIALYWLRQEERRLHILWG